MVYGYHQVEIVSEDRDQTAFITPDGLFQYCRMPFALAGAPGSGGRYASSAGGRARTCWFTWMMSYVFIQTSKTTYRGLRDYCRL
jgi:hypothetical protein